MQGEQRKKVLIVSYFFPPANTVGAVRIGKFAKYLDDFGWEPWVLTVRSELLNLSQDLPVEIPAARVLRAGFGPFERLLGKRGAAIGSPRAHDAQKRPGGGVIRRLVSKPLKWIALHSVTDARLPDRALPWYGPAIAMGDTLLAGQKFDAIFSSNGPPGSGIVASVLARRHGLPWVADFRDLWTQNHGYRNRPAPIHRTEQVIEKRVIARADTLVTISPPFKEQLESLHKKRVVVVTNGFDAADYPDRERVVSGGPLRLVYTGMIYEGEQDPSPLFSSLAELIREKVPGADEARIEFYGTTSPFVAAKAKEFGVSDFVSFIPRLPQKDVREKQLGADALLLLDWTHPSVQGYYSAKVFEYLGARKPILAIGRKGTVIEGLIAETRAGAHASTASEAKDVLRSWLAQKTARGLIQYEGDSGAISKYTRRERTRLLAGVLDDAVARHAVRGSGAGSGNR